MNEDEKKALAEKMPETVRDTFLAVANMLDRRKKLAELAGERLASPLIVIVEALEDAERDAFLRGAAVLGGFIALGEWARAAHFRTFPTRFEKYTCIDEECPDCGAAPGEYCEPGCPNDE